MPQISCWNWGDCEKTASGGEIRQPFSNYILLKKQSSMSLHNCWLAPICRGWWGNGKVSEGDSVAFLQRRLGKGCLWLDVAPSHCFLLTMLKTFLFTREALNSLPLSSTSLDTLWSQAKSGSNIIIHSHTRNKTLWDDYVNSNRNFSLKIRFLRTNICAGKRQRGIGEELKWTFGNPMALIAVKSQWVGWC